MEEADMKKRLVLLFSAALVFAGCQMEVTGTRSMEFVHPGVLHTQDEFEALRTLIARWETQIPSGPAAPEPVKPNLNIYSNSEEVPFEKVIEYRDLKRANRTMYAEYRAYKSWQWLKASPQSSATYSIKGPYDYVARDGTYSGTNNGISTDTAAAYQNALMWVLTGNRAHANKSFEILDAYAHRLKGILGGDYRLMAGLQGMTIAAAVEILRYAKDKNGQTSGFIPEQFVPIENMLRNVWIAAHERFFSYPPDTEGNVGLTITAAYMAMGICLDDRNIYQKAIDQTLYGADNGTLLHYINHTSGQIQESDRDQGHAMLGFQLMGFLCETAWKQGDDLFAAFDNSLYRATEFVTRYNSGDNNITYTIPIKFEPDNRMYWFNPKWIDIASVYPGNPYVGNPEWGFWGARNPHELNPKERGVNRPSWELIYNHYRNRRGMYMPWTESYLYRDGEGQQSVSDSTPCGGSFLFSGVEVARRLNLYETKYQYF
jgi:hypothetical protein